MKQKLLYEDTRAKQSAFQRIESSKQCALSDRLWTEWEIER